MGFVRKCLVADKQPGSRDVVAELSSWLENVLAVTTVTGLTRLSGGASRETWTFEADGHRRILQRSQAGVARDMSVEADVLRAAHGAGVPVPAVLASGVDASAGDAVARSYIVSEFVAGETIARKILRDEPFARAREVLVPQAGRALAALHSIDVSPLSGLEDNDPLVQWRGTLDQLNRQLGQAHPAFELAFRWLEANRPAPGPRRLVHGDFRLGNLMIGPDGLVAVLDWELAHLGDPVEDLGWLCVRAWRFGAGMPVAGLGEYDSLIGAYNDASGASVTREQLRWWEVLGTLKWGIMCMIQVSTHMLGYVRSHEHAAIGRRVCENEYDLFVALDGAWSSMGVDR